MKLQLEESKRAELEEVVLFLARTIDISKTQYDNLVKSYSAVGKFLEETPEFQPYYPVISPQGSLRLGTIIQPVNKDDDLDVDLVFRFTGKNSSWTQKIVKDMVGRRLSSHGVYREMLDTEGRRCWTLLYRQESENIKEKYHMDILPSVADRDYQELFKRVTMSEYTQDNANKVAIRITDKEAPGYSYQTDEKQWLKSNPDGYAFWFAARCKQAIQLREAAVSKIIPIGEYQEEKCVLQRVIQILKRHRDLMFNGDEDKPISIIITTLAAESYNGESNILDGLYAVIYGMESHIRKDAAGRYFVANPVNPEENFADKWQKYPKRQANFFRWLRQVKEDFNALYKNKGTLLKESISKSFGRQVAENVFDSITEKHRKAASDSKVKIAATGMLGSIGKTLNASNTFYGYE